MIEQKQADILSILSKTDDKGFDFNELAQTVCVDVKPKNRQQYLIRLIDGLSYDYPIWHDGSRIGMLK